MKSKIQIIEDIYNSEINFAIMSPCWDGGYTVAIHPDSPYGDIWNKKGCLYRADHIDGLDNAIDHLIEKVLELYPGSLFACQYNASPHQAEEEGE